MKSTPIEDSKNKLVVELEGADSTVCNLLAKELWNDDKMKVAAYNVDHPLIGKPKLFIETTGARKPKDAVKDAVKRIKKDITEASKSFKK